MAELVGAVAVLLNMTVVAEEGLERSFAIAEDSRCTAVVEEGPGSFAVVKGEDSRYTVVAMSCCHNQ